MKSIKVELPNTGDIEIIPMFDLHIGSKKCDYKLIKETIADVANSGYKYIVIGGDLINNSTKTSVGDVYSDPLSPQEQMKEVISMFEPVKDKILCVTSGNHERRTYKQDGIDLMEWFCFQLGISDRYDYCACVLFLEFGTKNSTTKRRRHYSMYLTHGDGNGGRTVGSKANGLERRGDIISADIVITGHTHQAMTFVRKFYKIDEQNKIVTDCEQTFVNAGSWLDYEEYAEINGLRPSAKKNPTIYLGGIKKEVFVKI